MKNDYPFVTDLLKKAGGMPQGEIEQARAGVANASIYFHARCALKCSYCVSNMFRESVQRRAQKIDEIGGAKYLKGLRSLLGGRKHSILLGGPGEVVESKWFVMIAKGLLEDGHKIVLGTNLHGIGNVKKVFDDFPPEVIRENVGFNISYHLGTYLDRGGVGERMRRRFMDELIPYVAQFNPKSQIIIPMTPATLTDTEFVDELIHIRSLWEGKRCAIKAMELGHIYNGKRYPANYTEEEARRVMEIQDAVGSIRPMVDDPALVRFTGRKMRLKGMPCLVRIRAFRVLLNGNIHFCSRSSEDCVGNICDAERVDLSKFREVVNCPHEICSCKQMAYRNCLTPLGLTPQDYWIEHYRVSEGIDLADPAQRAAFEKKMGVDWGSLNIPV